MLDALVDTATKVEPPKVTDCQFALTGKVRCVQVMPSAEVAAMEEPEIGRAHV